MTETLKTLPKTLEGTYERILRNIPPDYQDFARRALWWLVDARRPLTTDEVAEAAILDPELETPFDPESRFFDPREDILEILGSLVSVTGRDRGSDGVGRGASSPATTITATFGPSDELRLSHSSVKEYLISASLSQCSDTSVRRFHVTRDLASGFILRSGLQYIFHYSESSYRAVAEGDFEEFPLLRYACEFWFKHNTSSVKGSDKAIEDASYSLFASDSVLKAWQLVYTPDQPKKTPFEPPDEPGQALHYASTIGLAVVSEHLLQESADVNGKTESGITPLHRGAEVSVISKLAYAVVSFSAGSTVLGATNSFCWRSERSCGCSQLTPRAWRKRPRRNERWSHTTTPVLAKRSHSGHRSTPRSRRRHRSYRH